VSSAGAVNADADPDVTLTDAHRIRSLRTWFAIDSRGRTVLVSCILLLGTIAVYLPVRRCGLFMDDSLYWLDNQHVHHGVNWTTIKWAFSSFDRGNWIPLSYISHALDYKMFGRSPVGPHVVNAILHALNAMLLFWLLKRATGRTGRSFMVAALFAVHPVNVEAVAWIAERKTVLSMVFFLAALGAYRWYVEKPTDRRFWTVGLLYALGLTAKAQVITLPFVLLLWDYWPLQRMFAPSPGFPAGRDVGRAGAAGRLLLAQGAGDPAANPLPAKNFGWLVKDKVSLFLLCLVGAWYTMQSEGASAHQLWPPPWGNLENAVFSYGCYLKNAIWPSLLVPMIPNRAGSLTAWQVGSSCALLLGITALVIAARSRRYLVVGWLWFLGTLVPTLQVIQFGREGVSDRFAYQAMIGLFIMVCWGVSDWAEQHTIAPAWLAAVGVVVVLALTLTTHRQIGYWESPSKMWRHALEIKDNWMAENQLAREDVDQGRQDEAFRRCRRVLALLPEENFCNIQFAIYAQKHGQIPEAIAHYEQALRDWGMPQGYQPGIYRNLSIFYRQLGDATRAEEYAAKFAEASEAERIREQHAR
jgi:protein O-mannosyl-transferase